LPYLLWSPRKEGGKKKKKHRKGGGEEKRIQENVKSRCRGLRIVLQRGGGEGEKGKTLGKGERRKKESRRETMLSAFV